MYPETPKTGVSKQFCVLEHFRCFSGSKLFSNSTLHFSLTLWNNPKSSIHKIKNSIIHLNDVVIFQIKLVVLFSVANFKFIVFIEFFIYSSTIMDNHITSITNNSIRDRKEDRYIRQFQFRLYLFVVSNPSTFE